MPKQYWTVAATAWLLLCACCPAFSAASSAHFTYDVWDTEKGLPQNSVFALTQTHDGYLWVGTAEGLARFDGTSFTTFNEGNTPGLAGNQIVKLFEDSRSNLWIGTESAGVFIVKEGKVRRMDLGGVAQLGKGSSSSICEDANGAVWLYTASGQLCRWQNDSGVIWPAGSNFSSPCRALAVDGQFLWVGHSWGLRGWTLTNLEQAAAGTASGLSPAFVMPGRLDFLLASRQGGYWRLANGGIQKCKGNQLERDYGPYPWSATCPVAAACEDRDGNLIVGTYGEGVFWLDGTGHFNRLKDLPHTYVLSLLIDRAGCLWVGTDGGGLVRVKQQVFDVLEGSKGLTVQSVCDDRQGGVWVGYHYDRLEHYRDGQVEQFTNLAAQADIFLPPDVKLYVPSVFVDAEQRVWAGTESGGTENGSLLQLDQNRFRRVSGGGTLSQVISAIYQDRTNGLWAGTQNGLAQWNGQEWKLVLTPQNGLLGKVIRAITQDSEGNLWIGTEDGGLNCWQHGHCTTFSKTDGLPSNSIFSLCADEQGVLWVGTSSGLARYQGGAWKSLSGQEELPNGSIGYILDDGRGYLWLGSNSGLFRTRKSDLNDLAAGRRHSITVRSYGKADGLPTRECAKGSQPAACRTRDGRLWFATIKGLVSVDPARLQPNTNPPPVLIESVLLDGRSVEAKTLGALPPKVVEVPAGKQSLEIKFANLDLSGPEKGRFRYRLVSPNQGDPDVGWNERAGALNTVLYTKLPPGHYRFEVTACNEDGAWNPVSSFLAVTVLPPFWRTPWFITVTTLSLLGLVVGAVWYVSTQKLQRQLAVMRQHEALEKERARIARDLHDQLGANLTQIALLGELAESDKELPGEVESHAQQISSTARETTNALDEIVWTVNPANDTLDGLINYICKYAQDYLALGGLSYRLEVPPNLPKTEISPELRHNVFLVAKEAINNIVKHAHASAAWVRLQLEPDRFVLEIEDNGHGLSAAAEKKGRNGLRNMRKRMEDVGGKCDIGPGTEAGTRVRLSVPLSPCN